MSWFVVNTDLTITTKKVNDLFSTMKDGSVDGVGRWLGLSDSKRSEIKRNYHSPAQRREAYIDVYVNEHPHPTWKQLSEVLRTVGLPNQADVVESTYVQGTVVHRHRYTHCLYICIEISPIMTMVIIVIYVWGDVCSMHVIVTSE